MQKNSQGTSMIFNQNLANFIRDHSKQLEVEALAKAYQEANAEIDHDFDICSGDGLALRTRKKGGCHVQTKEIQKDF